MKRLLTLTLIILRFRSDIALHEVLTIKIFFQNTDTTVETTLPVIIPIRFPVSV